MIKKQVHSLTEYQRGLCSKEILDELSKSHRPTPARFFEVALGQSTWTPEEQTAIAGDVTLQRYEARVRATVMNHCDEDAPPNMIHLFRPQQELRAVAKDFGAEGILLCAKDSELHILVYTAFEGHSTVQLIGPIPEGTPQLYIDGHPLHLVQPFDEYRYATVDTHTIQRVLDGGAELGIRFA